MKLHHLLASFACCLLFSGQLLAADYEVKPLDEAPPEELAPEIAKQLSATGHKMAKGNRTVADIWLPKALATKADFKPSFTILYPFEVGQLIGAIRFKRTGEDFRGQEIPAGVYTLRYALQPVDGNHVGTSDTRDFLLLIKAKDDKSVAKIAEGELWATSAEAIGTSHPAMLSMLPSPLKPEGLPKVDYDDMRDLHSVVLEGQTAEKKPLILEFVLVGHAEL